jgi:hypothetical protein
MVSMRNAASRRSGANTKTHKLYILIMTYVVIRVPCNGMQRMIITAVACSYGSDPVYKHGMSNRSKAAAYDEDLRGALLGAVVGLMLVGCRVFPPCMFCLKFKNQGIVHGSEIQ